MPSLAPVSRSEENPVAGSWSVPAGVSTTVAPGTPARSLRIVRPTLWMGVLIGGNSEMFHRVTVRPCSSVASIASGASTSWEPSGRVTVRVPWNGMKTGSSDCCSWPAASV